MTSKQDNKNNESSSSLGLNLLKKEKGKYHFQGQAFTKKNWYRKMGNYLYIGKDEVYLRRTPDEIRLEYIKLFILRNIRKATFLMLILPSLLFLGLALLILIGSQLSKNNLKFLDENQIIFIRFLGILFFIMGSGLLVKVMILQDKVIMLGNEKRGKTKYISKKQYQGVLDVFKKNWLYIFQTITRWKS